LLLKIIAVIGSGTEENGDMTDWKRLPGLHQKTQAKYLCERRRQKKVKRKNNVSDNRAWPGH
jgi:hypothetical protein